MRTVCSLAVVAIAGFIVGVLVMAGCGGRNAETPRAQAADGGQAAVRKILFVGRGPRDGIYAINPDGTGLKRVYRSALASLAAPHWSPDGTRIVFYREDNDTLWVMNADGTKATELPGTGCYPSW